MSDERSDSKHVEQRAPEQSPENVPPPVPAPELPRETTIGVRRGMFGAPDSGDTSGYGGLVKPVVLPGAARRPYGGWYDEVADALEATMGLEGVVIHRGEITFHVRRQDLVAVAKLLRDDPRLRFEFCAGVSGVHYPGPRAPRGLSPALDDLQPAGPPRGGLPRRRPAHPEPGGGLPDQRLARA